MKSRRVLHLIDTDFLSGPGKTIFNSWRFTDRKRFDVLIAVFSNGQNDYVRFLKEQKAPVIEIPEKVFGLSYQLSYIPILFKLIKIIRRNEIDILHTHHHKADFFGLLAGRISKVKLVSTHHGFIENTDKAVRANRIARWSTSKMDSVIAVSDKMLQDLLKIGMPIDKLHMIHNAIVTSDYPVQIKSSEILHEHQIPDNYLIIGSVGRISAEKGQEILCEAFIKTMKKISRIVLLLVGSGEEQVKLQKKYSHYADKIIFAGFRKNIRDYISVFDVHVLPSFTEGLPNVVLETSLMGIPNIVTEVGGNPECVINNQTGLVVPAGDIKEMSDALQKLLNDKELRDSMSKKGISFIQKEYGFGSRMHKIMNLYDVL